jgi:tetratricopeptide (TPR) repeat protein
MSHIQRFGLAALAALVLPVGFSWAQEAAAPATDAAAAETEGMRDPIVEEAMTKGAQLLTEQKYKEAVAEFNRALSVDPTYPDAYVGKGDALKGMEDYQTAINAYTQAIQFAPQNAPPAGAFNGRGEAYLELGQGDVAMTDFTTAVDIDPNNPKILSNIGHLLILARDPQNALRRLDDAIALDGTDARAFRDRAYAHVLLEEYDKAAEDIKKAVEVAPDDYENYSTMASMLLLQDSFGPAVDALTKAIDTYKPTKVGMPVKFVDGYLSRADARLKLAEKETDADKRKAALEGVIADADAVLALYGDRFPYTGRAYFRKGRAQRMLEDYGAAIDSFTDAIGSVPAGQDIEYLADALMYKGICWYYMDQPELARGDFEQASATGGGYQDPRVFLWIGHTHHVQGNFREAIAAYNGAIAKAPHLALAHVNKGRAYMDLKEYNRALDSFRDAIREEPSVGEHYYKVAFAYMKLDDPKKAVDFLTQALAKDNPQPKMYRLMATAMRELGRNELADEYQRKAEVDKNAPSGG